jgi:putative ubiquitin-RnfH superfamily antitoxin RatB of RatAB toxin-antitoxin module
METEGFDVEIVYAEPGTTWRLRLSLPAGASVADAIQASQFAKRFPNYPFEALKVGVYGQACATAKILAAGDRIEIYRPLSFDPMESRRRRAVHRNAFMTKPQNRPKRRKAKLAAGLLEAAAPKGPD